MNSLTRQSGIELLRIIAILGVIILHYNNSDIGGGLRFVEKESLNQYILIALESLFVSSVNVFIMISAYFLSATNKRSVIKIIELIVQISLFRVMLYILGKVLANDGIVVTELVVNFLPVNYFVILYSALYLISPYINRAIDGMTKEQMKKMLCTVLILFSILPFGVDLLEKVSGCQFNGLSTIGLRGSQDGYTIVNFIVVYIVGAYLRKNPINISNKRMLWMGACVACFNYIISVFQNKVVDGSVVWWNYDNPFLIVFSAIVVMLFLRINLQSKFINEISKATFTCYLIHIMFLKYVKIELFVNDLAIKMIAHIVTVAIGSFFVSYVAYKIYYTCTNCFFRLLEEKIQNKSVISE